MPPWVLSLPLDRFSLYHIELALPQHTRSFLDPCHHPPQFAIPYLSISFRMKWLRELIRGKTTYKPKYKKHVTSSRDVYSSNPPPFFATRSLEP